MRSAAGDGGEEVDFAVGLECFEEGVGDDFAVDGDGAVCAEGAPQLGEARVEGAQELSDVRGVDVDAGGAAGQPGEWLGNDDGGYGAAPPVASTSLGSGWRAARSRGGDMGAWCMRRPVASAMALAMAASGGTMGTSPTPRTP